MKDLYKAIDSLNNILKEAPPQGRQDGPGTRQGTTPKPKPAGPAAYNSVGDMMKAIATPGRQGVSDPNQSAKNIAAAQPKPAPAAPKPKPAAFTGRPDDAQKPAAAPKINPAVPAAGPVRANPIDPQAMAATRAAASVVNAPKPAAPAPRAKVKATAANTKDFDKTVALQKKLGVTADGIMGPQTRAAMAAAKAKQGSPAPTGTARKVSTVAPGAAPTKTASTPMDAGEFSTAASGQDAAKARVARSNAALAKDFKKVKDAGSGILDKIGAGISSIFKPSTRSVRGRRQAAAPAAGPNAAGSNFATAADGTISRTDNPRQPGDAAPTNRFDRAKARMQAARDRKAARGDTTPVSVSDVQNAAAQSRAAVAATAAAPTTRTVRQRVTDPDEKAAIMRQMNTARERQRLALAAGSTDPDDIRAYQRRMANTRGTGAAGGTDPNTF